VVSSTCRAQAALDPLGYGQPLPLVERFFPRGFPLVLKTNSQEIIAALREGMDGYRPAFDAPPIEMRIVVEGDAAEPVHASPESPVFRAQGHLLITVLNAGNVVACDLDAGFVFGRLTPGVARNHLFASFHFLESAAYCCLEQRHFTSIHAACIAKDGEGALLVGGSGTGKSTLALACARAGLTYVCDDASSVLRHTVELTVVGRPQRARIRPPTLDLIPELAQARRLPTVIGKDSFEIRTSEIPGIATADRCRARSLIFLERQCDGDAEIFPVTPEEALERLAAVSLLYSPHVEREHGTVRERLARCRAVRLRYSGVAAAVRKILAIL
jgi:hypothetical protein